MTDTIDINRSLLRLAIADRLTQLRADGWKLTILPGTLPDPIVRAIRFLGWPSVPEVAACWDREEGQDMGLALDLAIERAAADAWQRVQERQLAYRGAGPVVFKLTTQEMAGCPAI